MRSGQLELGQFRNHFFNTGNGDVHRRHSGTQAAVTFQNCQVFKEADVLEGGGTVVLKRPLPSFSTRHKVPVSATAKFTPLKRYDSFGYPKQVSEPYFDS